MSIKVALISLLGNYHFTVNKKTMEPIQMKRNSLVLAAKGGIWFNAEKM